MDDRHRLGQQIAGTGALVPASRFVYQLRLQRVAVSVRQNTIQVR